MNAEDMAAVKRITSSIRTVLQGCVLTEAMAEKVAENVNAEIYLRIRPRQRAPRAHGEKEGGGDHG